LTVLTVFTFYRLVFYRCLHVCLQLRSDSCPIQETFDLILGGQFRTFVMPSLQQQTMNLA